MTEREGEKKGGENSEKRYVGEWITGTQEHSDKSNQGNVSFINNNLSSFLKSSLLKGEDDRGVQNEQMPLGRRRQFRAVIKLSGVGHMLSTTIYFVVTWRHVEVR